MKKVLGILVVALIANFTIPAQAATPQDVQRVLKTLKETIVLGYHGRELTVQSSVFKKPFKVSIYAYPHTHSGMSVFVDDPAPPRNKPFVCAYIMDDEDRDGFVDGTEYMCGQHDVVLPGFFSYFPGGAQGLYDMVIKEALK